jgi:hypothetical protein
LMFKLRFKGFWIEPARTGPREGPEEGEGA